MDWLNYGQRLIPNNLRKFDLVVGDKVRVSRKGDDGSVYWTVKKIFPYVFLCEDKRGIKTTFQKVEYLLGEVICTKHARDVQEESLW